MPVFVESAHDARDTRINPAHLTALPRLAAPPPTEGDNYEVVVVGSGPAGILSSVLLARYGLASVLTVDSKPESVHAGQADGLQPRTLEVLQSLDLAHEVLTQGCQMHEVAFWNPTDGDGKGIERTAFVPDVAVAARYPHEVTIHQGRIERILNEDLEKHGNAVQRGWEVTKFQLEEGEGEFPVVVTMQKTGGDEKRVVRCKHLIGADGAHSTVRKGMGLSLEGDTTDHVWGVIDTVCTTTFPDIRKRCAIHSSAGSIMIIPRERISGGAVLTRIYCQMEDSPAADKVASKESRGKVTLERIMEQARRVLAPYTIEFGHVDWWAAYQIGQRVAPKFQMSDSKGVPRVHIAGDACHTHSPKAGQGMNVSMMDAYNLSWKLAHTLLGLAPSSILHTYESERHSIAEQLIAFDRSFSTLFSTPLTTTSHTTSGLTHDEFLRVFRTGGGFTSGCGIEYSGSTLVDTSVRGVVTDGLRESGLLWPGRRVMNVRTKRFADANPRDLQDDMPSTGVYRLLVLLPSAFRATPGDFAGLLTAYSADIPARFPQGAVETVIVFPGERGNLEWTDFPACVRAQGEWTVLGDHYGCVYGTFSVDVAKGAVAVVRPDGYVGVVAGLQEGGDGVVDGWLRGVLVGV